MNISKFFPKYIVFPIQDIRTDIGKSLKKIEKSQWLSQQEIKEIQFNKLQKLLISVYSNVPYYRALFDKEKINSTAIKSFKDFSKIPLLSKKIIHENFDDMLSLRVDKKTLIEQTTSGSTGEPVTILRDTNTDRLASASGWRFRNWGGHDVGEKFARIWGRVIDIEPVDKKNLSLRSRIGQKLNTITEPTITLSAFEMSESAMEDFFMKIKKEKITHLIGYVSGIYFFSLFVNKYHTGELKLKSVRTIAEMLYRNQRQSIEKAFTCKVFDTYGNRENGLIAAECACHEGLHINAENLYVEVVDPTGKPVPNGECGDIVITDLNNYAMPLIRYITGDRGKLSEKICSCGRGLPLIEEIDGRTIDMLCLSDGNFLNGYIFIFFMWNFADEVERFTIVQKTKGEADLYLKLFKPFNRDRLNLLKKGLNNTINNMLSIKFHIVNDLPIHRSGKHKYIMSYL